MCHESLPPLWGRKGRGGCKDIMQSKKTNELVSEESVYPHFYDYNVKPLEGVTMFPKKWILPSIILTEGFVSIAVEILTIRQLLPFVGSSVIVTSLIIGIFLLFLAFGYQHGGKKTHHLNHLLRRNFFLGAIWLGIGLSYLFISLFFSFMQKILGPHTFYPLLGYLLFILAPLIFILGQTVPITLTMLKQNQSIGILSGNTLGLSTLGSFLGAILTTLVLMHYLGVAWTVFINFSLLILLALLLSAPFFSLLKLSSGALIAAFFVFIFNMNAEKFLFLTTNSYANYQVYDSHNSPLKKEEKMLSINETPASYINSAHEGFPYIEMIKKILLKDLHLHHADILVLGAGGFTLSVDNPNQNQFTYVDIDKKIKNIVVPHFLQQVKSSFVADDARHYLQTNNLYYNAIVIDVYSNTKAIASHLITQEYILAVQKRLKETGIAIFNIIANPMLTDHYSQRVDNTIRSVFHQCMVIPTNYNNDLTNILYVCRNNSNKKADNAVYTDNLNTSTTDFFNW